MGIKEENSRKIKELEEELSDEKLSELFVDLENEKLRSVEQARIALSDTIKGLIIIIALVVCIVILGFYLFTIV